MVLPDVRLPEKTTLFDLTSSLLAAAARYETGLPVHHQASVFHLTFLAWDVKKPSVRVG